MKRKSDTRNIEFLSSKVILNTEGVKVTNYPTFELHFYEYFWTWKIPKSTLYLNFQL